MGQAQASILRQYIFRQYIGPGTRYAPCAARPSKKKRQTHTGVGFKLPTECDQRPEPSRTRPKQKNRVCIGGRQDTGNMFPEIGEMVDKFPFCLRILRGGSPQAARDPKVERNHVGKIVRCDFETMLLHFRHILVHIWYSTMFLKS